jgi:hypothetical protein
MSCWYSEAEVCYNYLSDIAPSDNPREASIEWHQQFQMSKWFLRGWTLQELIAPKKLVFFSENWAEIGSKESLVHEIMSTSGVPRTILQSGDP